MPATFHIDTNLGLVYSVAWGRLTTDEAGAHHDALARHPAFKPDLMHLMDFTRVQRFELSPEDAGRLSSRALWAADARRAVAAPTDVAFGMSRLYQLGYSESEDHYGVFRSLEEAWRWLGIEDPPRYPPFAEYSEVRSGFIEPTERST